MLSLKVKAESLTHWETWTDGVTSNGRNGIQQFHSHPTGSSESIGHTYLQRRLGKHRFRGSVANEEEEMNMG